MNFFPTASLPDFANALSRWVSGAPPSPRKPAGTRKSDFESPTKVGERSSKKSATAREREMEVVKRLDFLRTPNGSERARRASNVVTPATKAQTVAEAMLLGWEPGLRREGPSAAAIAGIRVAHRRGFSSAFTADKVPLWWGQIQSGDDTVKPRGRPRTWLDRVGQAKFLLHFRRAQTHHYSATRLQLCAGCRRDFALRGLRAHL